MISPIFFIRKQAFIFCAIPSRSLYEKVSSFIGDISFFQSNRIPIFLGKYFLLYFPNSRSGCVAHSFYVRSISLNKFLCILIVSKIKADKNRKKTSQKNGPTNCSKTIRVCRLGFWTRRVICCDVLVIFVPHAGTLPILILLCFNVVHRK